MKPFLAASGDRDYPYVVPKIDTCHAKPVVSTGFPSRLMEPDQYLGWLALALTPGLGARMAGRLLGAFGSPDAIFNASLTALEGQRLPTAVAQAIHTRRPLSDAAKELAQAQAAGCRLLTWDEPEYPSRLREIYDPPPLLYVLGDVELLNRQLAIPRWGASSDPLRESNSRADCQGPGRTRLADRQRFGARDRRFRPPRRLARLGNHDRRPGMRDRRGLPEGEPEIFAEVEKRGADHQRISDGDVSFAGQFPGAQPDRRGNVAGSGVVQGAQYSGSLITSRLAMEFGREVFGVPGNVTETRALRRIS